MTTPSLNLRWHTKLASIPEPDWTRIFGTAAAIKSHAMARVVEAALSPNPALHYLTISDDGQILAIVPASWHRIRLDLLASPAFRAFAESARRAFPKFLTRRILFLGAPVFVPDNLFGIGIADDDPRFPALIAALRAAADAKARELKCPIVVARAFRANERARFARILGPNFAWSEEPPNAFVPVGGEIPPFPSALRQKYRHNVDRALRASAKLDLTWECKNDFAPLVPEMEPLYAQVEARSQIPMGRFDERFFQAIAAHCTESAFALTCSTREGRLVCFWIALEDRRSITSLLMGLDYSHPHSGGLYSEGTFRLVKDAERRGKRCLLCGQTAMTAKAYAGAVFERIWFATHLMNPLMALVMRHAGHRLTPTVPSPHVRCYTDHAAATINATLTAEGIAFEPLKTTGN